MTKSMREVIAYSRKLEKKWIPSKRSNFKDYVNKVKTVKVK